MKKNRSCLARKVGIFLLLTALVLLPVSSSVSFAAETPPAGPSIERGTTGREGDAGAGATKGLKKSTWMWIGGGAVALIAIIAAAGGGGGGGSTPTH